MVCCPCNMTLQWHGNTLLPTWITDNRVFRAGRKVHLERICSGVFGVLSCQNLTRGSPRVHFAPGRDSQLWCIHYSGQARRPFELGQPFLRQPPDGTALSSGPVGGQVLCALTCSSGWGLWLWLPELLLLLGRSHAHKGNASSCWKKIFWSRKRRAASFVGQPHCYATLTVRFLTFGTSEGHLKINWNSYIKVTGNFKCVSMF